MYSDSLETHFVDRILHIQSRTEIMDLNRVALVSVCGACMAQGCATLRIRDSHKDEKMAAIHKALGECSAEHPVL
ncbi:Insertion element IS630 uncharacterized 39 kDa protein ISO-IS200 39 kDa protein [Salmonella enterica subsp. arizonae]|uniref:Insertion element IS630 uncharacterized 39 kDa protein ISO-IS200 39 kDa protein n=2 Tax=Salmonella enterica TaxID=28901 RepID=A0A447R2L8_SALER|nr:Insertion element IS630 uncharacterized 39 kDa protein ISO-IS200 39 kDa protein [Salmonella enterica subsp. diarizonae]SUG60434.1 Insertion element IS630 uncharacterized 39 kDa protein ISO-IS200 39 kDa protein [Salmonella enterica subsp. arizonae]VEA76433.1 Insertion element IS630 uncharacterized 39 kDa protein ISO-IS200 39 kDa protein [Salmonella enterica subsp. arizonae]VFS70683.1 Insertion element IS630 uncharacterized 39 kDa protein ISO-IS200 39 kDa protein [Salmonella enterica subsp. dia